jgi:hypothetical protein
MGRRLVRWGDQPLFLGKGRVEVQHGWFMRDHLQLEGPRKC